MPDDRMNKVKGRMDQLMSEHVEAGDKEKAVGRDAPQGETAPVPAPRQ